MATHTEILIVSSDDAVREELAQICRDAGYKVATLGNLIAAPAALAELHCQLVLIDFAADGRKADRLAYHIHGLPPGGGRVPIVAIADDLLPETTSRLDALRVSGVIAKPPVPEEVLGQVAASIDLLAA
jgi:CheY-like chemotaxis protein